MLSFGRNREGMHSRQDLNALVDDTLKLMRLKLHQQKIELQFEPKEGSVYVDVNKGQILQVMLNLVLNATQAMPEGGRIRLETSTDETAAHLTITDNGNGIPKSIQSDIFESFLTDRPDGTGLGLSISKRNEDMVDVIDEYADMLGMSKACAVFHIIKDYNRLKLKERIRELEGAA